MGFKSNEKSIVSAHFIKIRKISKNSELIYWLTAQKIS